MSTITRIATAAAAGAVAVGVAGGAIAGGGSSTSTGPQYTYTSPSPFADASATVHVVQRGNGSAHVSLRVRGVDAPEGQTFGAHVHAAACGESVLPPGRTISTWVRRVHSKSEVWLDVTVDQRGDARSSATRPWQVDQSIARSVILHALPTNPTDGTAGARLACIDLDGG